MNKRLLDSGGGRIRDRTQASRRDLVTILGLRNKKIRLHRDAAQSYQNMATAFRKDTGIGGNVLSVTSGYRDPARQKQLWQRALRRYGTKQVARKWVAPPGRSAHQTGRAVDLHLGAPTGSKYAGMLRRTQAHTWLKNNADRFGFYPYEREPWHWEYNPTKGQTPPKIRIPGGGKRPQFFQQPTISRRGLEEIMRKGLYVPGVWGEEISLGGKRKPPPFEQPSISRRLEKEIMSKGIYVPGVWGLDISR